MREATIPLYKYEELSEKAKERALNTFREHNTMHYLDSDLREGLHNLLREYDIETLNKLDIFYSLSHSQGDGCCFVGEFKYDKYRITIKHQGHYNNSCSVNTDIELYEPYDEEGNDIIMSSDEEHEDIKGEIRKFEYDFDDFLEDLTKHLEENEVAIMIECGAEKLRYITGVAYAINSKGETSTINLNDIYEEANLLGNNITAAEY